MNVYDDIIRRSQGKNARDEDYAAVYGPQFNHLRGTSIDDGEYRGYMYVIWTNGIAPEVEIMGAPAFSAWGGAGKLKTKGADGVDRTVTRVLTTDTMYPVNFSVLYNGPGDYVKGKHAGKKYTIADLREDVKAFIDFFEKEEDEMRRHPD